VRAEGEERVRAEGEERERAEGEERAEVPKNNQNKCFLY
jgi:hypothetical protein